MTDMTNEKRCRCGRKLDRGGRTTKCSLCISEKSALISTTPLRSHACTWCGKSFKGRQKIYCSSFCRNSKNTHDKQQRSGSVHVVAKYCNKCERTRDAWMFNLDTTKIDGLSSSGCRECQAEKHKAWRSTPEAKLRMREAHLKRNFGLTTDIYDMLLDAQNGQCALCDYKPGQNNRRLSVDHSHVDGTIRSLLCIRCNRDAVGNLTPERAQQIADYLAHPPAYETIGKHVVPANQVHPQKRKRQPRKRPRGKNNG